MNRAALVLFVLVVGAGLAAGGYWFGQRHAQHAVPVASPAPSADPKTDASGRRILYWHDPMYPQQKFDKPGRSPFMNMDLVPVYEGDPAANLDVIEVKGATLSGWSVSPNPGPEVRGSPSRW